MLFHSLFLHPRLWYQSPFFLHFQMDGISIKHEPIWFHWSSELLSCSTKGGYRSHLFMQLTWFSLPSQENCLCSHLPYGISVFPSLAAMFSMLSLGLLWIRRVVLYLCLCWFVFFNIWHVVISRSCYLGLVSLAEEVSISMGLPGEVKVNTMYTIRATILCAIMTSGKWEGLMLTGEEFRGNSVRQWHLVTVSLADRRLQKDNRQTGFCQGGIAAIVNRDLIGRWGTGVQAGGWIWWLSGWEHRTVGRWGITASWGSRRRVGHQHDTSDRGALMCTALSQDVPQVIQSKPVSGWRGTLTSLTAPDLVLFVPHLKLDISVTGSIMCICNYIKKKHIGYGARPPGNSPHL